MLFDLQMWGLKRVIKEAESVHVSKKFSKNTKTGEPELSFTVPLLEEFNS